MIKRLGLIAILLMIVSCGDSPTGTANYVVKYEVTGIGGVTRANVTYKDVDGDWAHADNTSLPWTITFGREDGSYVYVSAEMIGTGTVIATIYKGDLRMVSDSSSNPNYRAIAEGYL